MLASDIVNHYPEQELADLIYRFGEDPAARHIAKCIVRNRPIATSLDLGEIIQNNLPKRCRKIHPATLTFQALRIAVNDELNSLENGLEQALSLLGSGGRIVVISYHSLEDRIVKNLFKRESSNCICPPRSFSCQCEHAAIIKQISRKVFKPSKIEINKNPRARSAKMRIAERI
jgi:16S rRNA (cytosine1402-N4)-methyltransferase